MSLCFTDEHMAWQQRINKEKFVASMISPLNLLKSPLRVYDSRNSTPIPRLNRSIAKAQSPNRLRHHSKDPTQLPLIHSRQSGNSIFNFSVKSSQMAMSDFEGKSLDELKEIIKQERLRRLVAEQRLLEVKMKETGDMIKKLNNN